MHSHVQHRDFDGLAIELGILANVTQCTGLVSPLSPTLLYTMQDFDFTPSTSQLRATSIAALVVSIRHGAALTGLMMVFKSSEKLLQWVASASPMLRSLMILCVRSVL